MDVYKMASEINGAVKQNSSADGQINLRSSFSDHLPDAPRFSGVWAAQASEALKWKSDNGKTKPGNGGRAIWTIGAVPAPSTNFCGGLAAGV